jgi:hypothetical protein
MKNLNKILLHENTNAYNELIANAKNAYSNGITLLSMLAKIGLTVESVNDWEAIEQEFTKDYPKAPLTFNLQANGIETEFRDAEAFYLKHRLQMSFEPLTDAMIEQTKESQRVYATTESQIRAIELFNTIKDSLLELKDLGVVLDLNKTYLINRVLIGDDRLSPALTVEPKALYHTVINLK